MSVEKALNIFDIFARKSAEPVGELYYTNPYTHLVAVVLSAQATDISVNKATEKLFAVVSSPEEMLDLGIERLIEYTRHIGLYKTKSKNIMSFSQAIISNYKSKVPGNLEDLMSLAGVGMKSAKVVLNGSFGVPCIAVDTHIQRVSNRLGLLNTTQANKTSELLEEMIPEKYKLHAHHWLILHGRYICRARRPLCYECPIVEHCDFDDKNFSKPPASRQTNKKTNKPKAPRSR